MPPRPPVVGLPHQLDRDRCLVMGVVNVTTDSFSDGGSYFDADRAVAHGLGLSRDGADIVDVGGESTRPGARRVSVADETARVQPVIERLVAAGVLVSVDTMRAQVAEVAVAAGAVLVNDVSGGLADPDMLPFLASSQVPCVLMHWRGHSRSMMQLTEYPNGVVADVRDELRERMQAAESAGVDPERIVVDPGIGFAKQPDDNWPLLARLEELMELGRPVLVGASRKRFLGDLLMAAGRPSEPGDRDVATAAVSALVAAAGAWCVRVHDVAPTMDAVRVAAAYRDAGRS
ncbi:MAG: dihydropteroate synthase [Actinomycetes bacterium]